MHTIQRNKKNRYVQCLWFVRHKKQQISVYLYTDIVMYCRRRYQRIKKAIILQYSFAADDKEYMPSLSTCVAPLCVCKPPLPQHWCYSGVAINCFSVFWEKMYHYLGKGCLLWSKLSSPPSHSARICSLSSLVCCKSDHSYLVFGLFVFSVFNQFKCLIFKLTPMPRRIMRGKKHDELSYQCYSLPWF